MSGTALVILAVVVVLIAANGIYVAAEFATVSARRPRLAQLADAGNPWAAYILRVTESPQALDTYIAACQLGITLSSIVLGFYGQAQILALVADQLAQLPPGLELAARSGAANAILLVLAVLQVILGELMPKNVGIQYPERLAIATAPIMRWSVWLYHPLIWLFNGSGQFLLKRIGHAPRREATHVHSPDEIRILIEESGAGGVLDPEERRLLVNTLQMRRLTARKVMIPRSMMLAASAEQSCDELIQLLATSSFSRLPLYADSIDTILGVVHLKDLLQVFYERRIAPARAPRRAASLLHPVVHVPDSAPVEEVMRLMQQGRSHIAIVINEYGSTAGMITFEDLVEEIIGEFQDEFDLENPALELRANKRVRVRGDVQIDMLNELLGLRLPTDEVDTIGGLVFSRLGQVPHPGDVAVIHDLPIRVDRMDGNRLLAVSFPVTADQAAQLTGVGAGPPPPVPTGSG